MTKLQDIGGQLLAFGFISWLVVTITLTVINKLPNIENVIISLIVIEGIMAGTVIGYGLIVRGISNDKRRVYGRKR